MSPGRQVANPRVSTNHDIHVKVYGTARASRAYAIRDFLTRGDVPFEWIEIRSDAQAREVGLENIADRRMPLCVFSDGTQLESPTIRQIAEKLGWYHGATRAEYDLAIYGAGPAGLSAAVYGASEGLKTVLIERYIVGGQAGTSSKIENYLGFPAGVRGADLAEAAREQALKFGAEILMLHEGVRGEFQPGKGTGYLADGTRIVAHATICATGVSYRRLNIPDEDRLLGAGLYYGAGASEASLCPENEHVFVIGGGNSAGQAVMNFAKYVAKVTMIIRRGCLQATLSQYLIDRILANPRVEVLYHTEVTDLHGESCLREITLTNRETGEQRTLPSKKLFVCIGGDPRTDWAIEAGIARDAEGYILTGPDIPDLLQLPKPWPLERHPYFLESSIPGLFAAGDVRHGSIKRCASAVGEGAMAVAFVHRYLAAS